MYEHYHNNLFNSYKICVPKQIKRFQDMNSININNIKGILKQKSWRVRKKFGFKFEVNVNSIVLNISYYVLFAFNTYLRYFLSESSLLGSESNRDSL